MSKYRALICVLCLLFVPTLLLTETATKKKKRKPKKPAPGITPSAQLVPVEAFNLPDGLEVSVWATSPMFYNPTNMDVDHKGRIWVTEAINYRNFRKPDVDIKHPEGDRVVVLEDTDGDGKADKSTVFVQDADLVAPLGIGVLGNRIYVSSAPSVILYTDVNNDLKFDPKVDKKEIFLTGFGGKDHDHSLHAVKAGPDGEFYLNAGNAGPHIVKDKSGWTLRAGSSYNGGAPSMGSNKPGLISDDGRIWVGGVALRIRPDGTGLTVIGHNFRNSYEECVTSFGDVFQNDNDDPPACRTTWLMEYGNLGFASADGSRSWRADQRPGQPTSVAEWRQEDPGTIPAGDVYGNGAPTGIVFYENGILGDKYRGLLLSCESARRVVWGYLPVPEGAGFKLERFSFFDPNRQGIDTNLRSWFRPADVAVGADGAIYVADWFDPGVGGHRMRDKSGSGTIYRIVPDGAKPVTPKIDLSTTVGQVAAMKSPAPNVRYLGFERLVEQGEASLNAAQNLTRDASPYIRARGIWLQSKLGPKGIARVEALLRDKEPQVRILAFRALRRANHRMLEHAAKLADDPSIAVRREVLLALRDVPLEKSKDLLLKLAESYDGKDRWYLEAFGIACEKMESEVFRMLLDKTGSPLNWDARFAGIAWRLHPPQAVPFHKIRAMSPSLNPVARKQSIDALAFTFNRPAAKAMLQIAKKGPGDLQQYAAWWVRHRHKTHWREYDLARQLPAGLGVGVPQNIRVPKKAIWSSETIKGKAIAEYDVDITGASKLFLVNTDAGDGINSDWCNWIEPMLYNGEKVVPLASINWTAAKSGWGKVLKGRNTGGNQLLRNGERLRNSIGTHAQSVIAFDIGGGGFTRLKGTGVIDEIKGRNNRSPSVTFQVFTSKKSEKPLPEPAKPLPKGSLPPIHEIAKMKGNKANGQDLFNGRATCTQCHAINGKGGQIGPDLTGIGGKFGKEILLDSIVNPSSALSFGFEMTQVLDKDDGVYQGILISDGDPLVLRDKEGKQLSIAKNEIAERKLSEISMMPEATSLGLKAQDLADIVEFLMAEQ